MNFAAQLEPADETLSLTERAYLRLRLGILSGDLPPGTRLRAADLQDRFGLGLTPIREALMRLTSEGLVDAEAHRGSRVSSASLKAFADLMDARQEIEAVCLRRAIARGDAAWEAEIVASMHLLIRTPLPDTTSDRAATADWEKYHRRFHFALVSACGSEWLLRFWNTLADQSELYRAIRLLRRGETAAHVRDMNGEHTAIMNAVVGRDTELALRLMSEHLKATERAIAHLLGSESSDDKKA
ncbi:MAG: hypothetical protein JWO28_588 [Hyphomicrobiales bacterium]|jgi:GntR family carbon starvation induced transcriptional regulator|nr:hypothetical protein [Hyphomicrobiales bacterium]